MSLPHAHTHLSSSHSQDANGVFLGGEGVGGRAEEKGISPTDVVGELLGDHWRILADAAADRDRDTDTGTDTDRDRDTGNVARSHSGGEGKGTACVEESAQQGEFGVEYWREEALRFEDEMLRQYNLNKVLAMDS